MKNLFSSFGSIYIPLLLLIIVLSLNIKNNVENFGYELRRGLIGNESNKWIKLASVSNTPKSLTVDILPKNNSGASRQSFSVIIQNEPKIYSEIQYGKESLNVTEMKVVKNENKLEIWYKTGNVTNIPVNLHLDSFTEDDRILFLNDVGDQDIQDNVEGNIAKIINIDNSSRGDAIENRINSVSNSQSGQIRNLQNQINGLKGDINRLNQRINENRSEITKRVRFRDTIHIKGLRNNYLEDQEGRDYSIAKFRNRPWYYHQLKIVPLYNNDGYLRFKT